jgi:hypothetical protein
MSSNKSYKVTVSSSKASDKITIESSAKTWEELERELKANNISTSNMSIFKTPGLVQYGNIPFAPMQADPENPVDIVLVFSPLKMKSGGYAEDKAFVKECFAQKDSNAHYASVFNAESKSYTRMTKDELANLANSLRGGSDAPAVAAAVPVAKETTSQKELPSSVQESLNSIHEKLDRILSIVSSGGGKTFMQVQEEVQQADEETNKLMRFLGR